MGYGDWLYFVTIGNGLDSAWRASCSRGYRVSPPDSDTARLPAQTIARWFADEVKPHERSLRAYLRSVFPGFPDVDDLVQESYVRLIRAR